MSFSCELTFLPINEPNHEFKNKKDVLKLVKRINKKLGNIPWNAKVEPFHDPWIKGKTTFIVEICHFCGMNDSAFTDFPVAKILFSQLDKIFKVCDSFGLKPLITEYDKKTRCYKEYPSGGCHIHIGANLFYAHSSYFKIMEAFTKNLYTDYANRPYIKWLFAQFFDDTNSLITYGKEDLEDINKLIMERVLLKEYSSKNKNKSIPEKPTSTEQYKININDVYERGLWQTAIQLRMAKHFKNSYNTYEFRFFNMGGNAKEVFLMCKFMRNWVDLLVERTDVHGAINLLSFDLKPEDFDKFTDIEYMREVFTEFFVSLGLDFKDYEVFFKRNYIKRIKEGKLI